MMFGFPWHGKNDHKPYHFWPWLGLKLVRSLTCSVARCSMGPYLRDVKLSCHVSR